MTRPRLIPVLLLKHGVIVRSQGFRTHQVIGTPIKAAYSMRSCPEISPE